MNKLCFVLLALYAIHSSTAVTPEEVKEAQRLIEVKIYTTKHIAALTRRVVNTRYNDFIPISRRVWYAFQRDVEAHVDHPECTESANMTLLELEDRVINGSKEECIFDYPDLMEKAQLYYLDISLNEMKNAEETCRKPEVDYHKCMQHKIDKTKDSTDQTMEAVKAFPADMASFFQKCLINDLYANTMVVKTDVARKKMFDCIEKQ